MPSPFPGMDPYLEAQGRWADLRSTFIHIARNAIVARLPAEYVATIEERLYLVEVPGGQGPHFLPDVSITRVGPIPSPGRATPVGVATLEPVVVPFRLASRGEVRERRIEIRRQPGWEVVTVIEVLSPTNKVGDGRSKYLEKRLDLLGQLIHLVELDLLLNGARMPMGGPLPPGDYFATVACAENRPLCDVYGWTIRRNLPTIPIPLKSPDADVPLDLAAVFATAYEQGQFAKLVDYAAPLPFPLEPDDRSWAEGLAHASVRPR